MNERIKQIRNAKGMTQQEFADFLNVGRSNIANYENGNRTPVYAMVTLICDRCNVNREWLLTGKGPMQLSISRDQEIKQLVENAMTGSSDFKKAVIRMICSRSEQELKLLADMLREIYENLPEEEKNTAAARSGDRMEVKQLSREEEDALLPPHYTGDI